MSTWCQQMVTISVNQRLINILDRGRENWCKYGCFLFVTLGLNVRTKQIVLRHVIGVYLKCPWKVLPW